MSSYDRPIEISYEDSEVGVRSLKLPNVGGGEDISLRSFGSNPRPYDMTGWELAYRPGAGHAWAGKKIYIQFDGYFDESQLLWARRIDLKVSGHDLATLKLLGIGQPVTAVLDHLPALISGLGVSAKGSFQADSMAGGRASDIIHGLLGKDIISGGDGDDILFGDEGGDILRGGKGADTLEGGAGIDHVWGGKGHDVFALSRYYSERDGLKNRDVIEDFAKGDAIDMRQVEAMVDNFPTRNALKFIDGARFSGHGGEVRFYEDMVRADTNGDRKVDIIIELANGYHPDASDFFF